MKFYRNLFFFILISLAHVTTFAREIQFKSFEILSRDLTARTKRVDDLNGKMCALIKVALPVEDCKFEGDVIRQSFDVNEYLVYMPEGSKRLRIKCPGFETLQVELTTPEGDIGVKSGVTYSLKLAGYEDMGLSNKPVDPGANYLILDITPKTGLSVKVDGMLQTVDNGQVMTFLKYGTHSYAVEAEGYASAQGTAVIGKDGNTTIQVHLESIMATLMVTTETEGATIKINGQAKGTGNVSGQYVPGIYQIEIGKDGYRPYTQTIELAQRDNRSINIPALTPIYGALNIAYKPIGALITIDGKKAGTTPLVISDVLIGKHNITINKEGYEPFNTSVSIAEGQTAQIEGILKEIRIDVSTPASKSPSVPVENKAMNGHEYVDLGLPSGTKWATCNVGAFSPYDYGDYYAWGETTTKSEFTESNSKTMNKAIGRISGNIQYDAARAKWGGGWRLPTDDEIVELFKKCRRTWTTQGGKRVYQFIGPNGNSIFLPAAGMRQNSSTYYEGKQLCYWTENGSWQKDGARSLNVTPDSIKTLIRFRYQGLSIRPVLDVSETSAIDGVINNHEYIDLGLPSGLKWATCNLGASTPGEYGDHYAWGETTTKPEYTRQNWVYNNKPKVDISANPQSDAARANWGGSWRIPTREEINELIRECVWTWVKLGGHSGYRVVGPNGKSIFLPASGCRERSNIMLEGSAAAYYSSTPHHDGKNVYSIWLNDDEYIETINMDYSHGYSIRPVSN